ncbi:putative RNA pseudouridine synthase [anaerobic digester metagenome]
MNSFTHPEHLPPERLDKVLAANLGLGLRRCRTMIEAGLVLVDGRPLAKGGMVRPGQFVSVAEPADAGHGVCDIAGVGIVFSAMGFAAISKPGGMHTVAGRGGNSLEGCLPGLGLSGWRLLNRLDLLTGGLVLAAAGEREAALYKGWQEAGQVRKWYLALAHGIVGEMELAGLILDDKRRVVRVTGQEDEALRHTVVRPVRGVEGSTLVLAHILKGRRHQIRAHLAHAGHPLVGDPVYGAGEPGGLFLHHWRLDMPGFTAELPPEWDFVDVRAVEAVRLSFSVS